MAEEIKQSPEEVKRQRIRVSVPDDAPPIPEPAARKPHKKTAAKPEPAEAKTAPKPRRTRARKTKEPAAKTAPAKPVEKPEARPARHPSRRRKKGEHWPLPIPPPPEGPRVATVNDQPALVIEGKIVPPHFFYGSIRSEASERSVLAEIKKAAERGLHLHCLYLEIPVDENLPEQPSEEAVRLLESVLATDPEARVMIRTAFTPADGWTERYPDAAHRLPNGELGAPSVCADDWWAEASKILRKLVIDLNRRKVGRHIIGYHVDRDGWFRTKDDGYDTSKAALAAFRKWMEGRYEGDVVALRASWYDGDLDFSTVSIPDYAGGSDLRATLLTDRRERRWVDYHDFLSDAHVQRIGALAHEVKDASKGAALVACSYGHTFEFPHPHSGHLSLARLLRCPDIDIVTGPPSYDKRKPGDSCPFPGPIDSIALAGKLFVLEEDYKTTLGKKDEADDYNPPLTSPQALEAAHWRGLGMALSHGSGVSWMDTWGNGWLNTPSIWDRAEAARRMWVMRLASKPPPPDVAVLIDERGMGMLQDPRLYHTLIAGVREAALRAGVSAGFYLLSDVTRRNFPDCKLYLFLNPWDVGTEVRKAIKERLHKGGKTLMWWYAPALMEYHRPALDRVREVTGIGLKPQPFASRSGTALTRKNHPITRQIEENSLCGEEVYEPTFYATEDDAVRLGEYNDTGLPSFVMREVKAPGSDRLAFRSVFLGEPYVSTALIRGLCDVAGVHVWDREHDVIHVLPPFLTIHLSADEPRRIVLPQGWEARDPLTHGLLSDLVFDAKEGETRIFLVGRPDTLDELRTAELPAAPALVEKPKAELPEPPPAEEAELPLFHIDMEEEEAVAAVEPPKEEKPPRQRRRVRRSRIREAKPDREKAPPEGERPKPPAPEPKPRRPEPRRREERRPEPPRGKPAPPPEDDEPAVTFRFRKKS